MSAFTKISVGMFKIITDKGLSILGFSSILTVLLNHSINFEIVLPHHQMTLMTVHLQTET